MVTVALWAVVLAAMVVLFRQSQRSGHFLIQVGALLVQYCATLALLWTVHPFRMVAIAQSVILLFDATAILGARHRRQDPRAAPPPAVPGDQIGEHRQRLARDLHDSIGNNLTIISLYARMGRRMAADHQLARIDETAQQTMHHIGRILHDLRTGAGLNKAGQLELSEAIQQVIDGVRDVVPAVALRIEGTGPVSPEIRDVACRVIREALVNGAKHGTLQTAAVYVKLDDQLSVQVLTRAERGRCPMAPVMSLGFGLRGLTEEVDALDGELRSGPRDDSHFEVSIRIPLLCRTGSSFSA